MDVDVWVRRQGGIVRSARLREQGWSGRALTTAVRAGVLVRPRGGWLAVPEADPELVAAARAGVVLTCVTQARRLGLWVLREERPHVAAPPHAGGVRVEDDRDAERRALVHWARPLVPRPPGSLVDAIENVLVIAAVCLPFEEALAIWNSAIRQGRTDIPTMSRLPLPHRARAVLDAVNPFADSGLESFVLQRLRWLGLRIVPQAWIAGHRVDFLIGERLVLQIDGGSHVGRQRDEDNRHDAQLMLMGFHVIRVGYSQVIHDWPAVQELIMRAVAQGLHRAAERHPKLLSAQHRGDGQF